MKKIIAGFIVFTFIAMSFSMTLASSYVGNSSSKKFHFSDCSSAVRIKSSNRVSFNTRAEAISSGYIPCKRCNP